VSPGDVAVVDVETACLLDLSFLPVGGRKVLKVADPSKVVIVFNHLVPAPTAQVAEFMQTGRSHVSSASSELDPSNIDFETWVNEERRQRFNTRNMAFSYWEYIEYLSRNLTLYPGDIISGGTAADSRPRLADGQFAPERFLKSGDVVEIKLEAIETLRSRVVPKWGAERPRRLSCSSEAALIVPETPSLALATCQR
jgi:hypothetical protein